MKFIKLTLLTASVLSFTACTKLEEKLNSDAPYVPGGAAAGNPASLLLAAYKAQVSPLGDQARVWSLETHSTDEVMGPTRGGDWDDNGVWRVIHNHKWDADHSWNRETFRELALAQFAATSVLDNNPSAQQAAEAKFLRAHAMFWALDLWDQVPFRPTSSGDLNKSLPENKKGTAAVDFLIGELNAAIPALPAVRGTGIASKDAARALLMKLYLNKGAYGNRKTPTFAAADMNQVIALADQILANPLYSFAANYFDNFAPMNHQIGNEIIYTVRFDPATGEGSNANGPNSRYFCTLHYNQNPSGWNGFTTLGDFYDKFEAGDLRKSQSYTGLTNVSGMKAGFLFGQQYDQNSVALKDRKGAPLSFTKTALLKETGNNLEVTGIRVIKYIPDYTSSFPANNDLVIFRLSDIILMKAEAILRGGTATTSVGGYGATAVELVNKIRTHATRGASALGSVTLDQLLDERGRELYWEGWRRNDLIRFGKFLAPMWEKSNTSGDERLLYPIPNDQLTINPNLSQNPGY